MKKLFLLTAAFATMLFASCQKEEIAPAANGTTVNYTVEIPATPQTRAIQENGENINDLVYAVYQTEAETFEEVSEKGMTLVYQKNPSVTAFDGGVTNVSIELMNDQNYVILFWAQVNDAWVKGTEFDLTEITYPENLSANNADMAAFSGVSFLANVNGATSEKVTLTRPFAQINVGTTLPKNFTVDLTTSDFIITNAGTAFNVATQEANGKIAEELVFNAANLNNLGTLTVNDKNYTYVAMNYIFAKESVDVEFNIATAAHGTVNTVVPNVPVQKNYKTNIVGNLLTSNVSYEVALDDDWGTPDFNINVWDGSSVSAPQFSDELQAYVVKESSELAWLAAAVNGTLPETRAVAADNFAGKTFKLTTDFDLNNQEWTPIGTSSNPFKGTFDGNGYTVKNLKVTGKNSNVGLFGFTTDGEIKNLTVENASVSGRLNVAVVAGTPYTSKFTNITVKGHVEVNGMAYVGAVGGKNAYADWTGITVNVDETSYVNANSIENGKAYRTYVGGVVGFNGEGGHSFKNITSNIDVKGSTCDVGGMFGIAHYGNKFENCSCTGNVEIYAAEEADEAEEIGGIAGVWHNENGQTVTMTNCSFTGTLKTNITEGVDLSDNTLTGNAYNKDGNGKLIINGYESVTYGVGTDNDGNFYIYNAAGLRWVANVVNNTTPYTATLFDNKIVKLLNDIDLENQEWIPIGDDRSQRTEFHGIFDGDGHTVSNIKITKKTDREDDNKSSYGLFGNLKGTVKNLTITNVSISGAPKFIGALVGRMNDGLVENCHVKNSSVECNNWTIGGLVGQYNKGKISGCTVENTTIKGYSAVGGITGIALSEGERVIENCTVKNSEIIKNGSFGGDFDKMFGGIVGATYSGKLIVNLNNCKVENTIINGQSSDILCGHTSEGDQLLIDGKVCLTDGLLYGSAEKSYYVSKAAGLVYLSKTSIKGNESVVLTADIDLTGIEFNGLSAFNSETPNTFDGNNHKISNWTYNGGASDMAFIKGWVGTIKNVSIENAHLKTAGRSAVLAGNVYANIENCHVINSSIEDSYWACGLIAGLYNSGNVKNCSATNSSVKSNGGTGAIVGVLNESAGTRSFENCSVTGCTVNNTGIYGEGYSAALICGVINIANSTINFKNCNYSDNNKVGQFIGDLYYSAEGNTIVVE